MGAFDTYAGSASCPRCGDIHYLSGQTKFFLPDFGGLCGRHFAPGSPQRLDFDPSALAHELVWDDEWWRVREPAGTDLALLADFDDLRECGCGTPLALILRFSLGRNECADRRATLESILLLDAGDANVGASVDFASGEQIVRGSSMQDFARQVRHLAEMSVEQRKARLHDELVAYFAPRQHRSRVSVTWTYVVGMMRCEACGAEHERRAFTSLTHPDFGEPVVGSGWRGGELLLQTRILGDTSWLEQDTDRGYYLRVRPPQNDGSLTIVDGPASWGCGCGAGRAWVVMRFVVDQNALLLESMSLRTVCGRGDLADADLVYAPNVAHAPDRREHRGWRPASRDEAIAHLLASSGVP